MSRCITLSVWQVTHLLAQWLLGCGPPKAPRRALETPLGLLKASVLRGRASGRPCRGPRGSQEPEQQQIRLPTCFSRCSRKGERCWASLPASVLRALRRGAQQGRVLAAWQRWGWKASSRGSNWRQAWGRASAGSTTGKSQRKMETAPFSFLACSLSCPVHLRHRLAILFPCG